MSDTGSSYLLDTNMAIWLDRDIKRVSLAVLKVLQESDSRLYVSAVSFWELSIKQGLGKIDGDIRLERSLETYGMQELGISSKYTDTVRGLPMLHGDPFDRMLVAQAMVEGMVLVTGDRRLAGYPVAVLQV
ncbi:type II toxin-antitoxin system VapC family toxin [Edaphobacter aggregans]|uniref:type II toxin-antitoxin system VapC family toxin n=1 Tax=Edaphobacter aggregans TaxID=570835 RepID=UPI00055760D2|nr:type II toxin-antitoxin system VapC family toxin [Edaphobacter aggregans]